MLFISASGEVCKIEHSLRLLLVLVLPRLAVAAKAAEQSWELRPASQAGNYRRVKVVVDVEGKLKLNADGQDVKHLPIKVAAELQYSERVLYGGKQWASVRVVRDYQKAEAKIRLHETDLLSTLRPNRRIVGLDSTGQSALLCSPQGPLTR